jgi:hypothetical protein
MIRPVLIMNRLTYCRAHVSEYIFLPEIKVIQSYCKSKITIFLLINKTQSKFFITNSNSMKYKKYGVRGMIKKHAQLKKKRKENETMPYRIFAK